MTRDIRLRRLWALMVPLCLACATSDLADDPEIQRLAGDPVVTQLVARSEIHVILVVDPLDCLTCYTPIVRWIYWARGHPDRFAMVFTVAPVGAERRRLIPLRLLPSRAEILSRSTDSQTPLELVFRSGSLIYADTLSPNRDSSPLLDRLAEEGRIEVIF